MKITPELASAVARAVVEDSFGGVQKLNHSSWTSLSPHEALMMERTVERVAHHLDIEARRLSKATNKEQIVYDD